jgi:outer membrane protein OmpA-like peptidoglycan-associated protein
LLILYYIRIALTSLYKLFGAMRTSLFFALGVIFSTLFTGTAVSAPVCNDIEITLLEPSNYVVIGAFAIHKNAINFTATAKKNQHNAKYEMNYNRKLYYVYVMTTNDKEAAIAEALRLRVESPYYDTWVFSGQLGKQGINTVGTDINPVTSKKIEQVEASQTETQSTITPIEQPIIQPEVKSDPEQKQETKVEVPKEESEEISGKKFYFQAFRADNQEPVQGDIDVIDVARTRKMGSFATNKPVGISKPPSKEGNISLVCEIFGYRKVQHNINYNIPEGYGIENSAEKGVVVPFELTRLQKGDHAIMYNVYFFNDAAVMRPESRYEVTSLLDMLKENSKYKIKIHGHTNGNHAGKIISMGDGIDNFFSLSKTVDGYGSAKKLSEERANVIRKYLAANGVEESRMQVKAWGGKKAIYDKHHPQAQSNVRVEIEILEN